MGEPLFSFLYIENLRCGGHALLSPLLPAPLKGIGLGTIFEKCEILKAVFFV